MNNTLTYICLHLLVLITNREINNITLIQLGLMIHTRPDDMVCRTMLTGPSEEGHEGVIERSLKWINRKLNNETFSEHSVDSIVIAKHYSTPCKRHHYSMENIGGVGGLDNVIVIMGVVPRHREINIDN